MKGFVITLAMGCVCLGNVFSHTGIDNVGTTLDTTFIPLRWNLGSEPIKGEYNKHRSPVVLPDVAYDGSFIVFSSANVASYTYNICKGEEIVESGTIMLQPEVDERSVIFAIWQEAFKCKY